VAYFSMEIALEPAIPTYSGGLGVLAGDTIRSCADLGIPMVAVTLVHRRGYFRQRLGPQGQQTEEPDIWAPKEHAEPLPAQVSVGIEGRPVQIAGWRYWVQGANGAPVPVLLLDTDLPENSPADRRLTDALYSGDERHRLCQETILGIGGIRMLRALGHADIERFHLNEGHAALVAVELLEEGGADVPPEPAPLAQQIESLRARCVFTTHTPVPAGHDRFSLDLAQKVLGEGRCRWIEALGIRTALNMTELALASAAFVNGVAMRHGEVSRSMFPDYPIRSITNGIHAPTWASPSFRALFDRHIPGWRTDPLSLRYGVKIPLREIAWAHNRAKQVLLQRVNEGSSDRFEPGSRRTSEPHSFSETWIVWWRSRTVSGRSRSFSPARRIRKIRKAKRCFARSSGRATNCVVASRSPISRTTRWTLPAYSAAEPTSGSTHRCRPSRRQAPAG
jgi:starch phosphorylase